MGNAKDSHLPDKPDVTKEKPSFDMKQQSSPWLVSMSAVDVVEYSSTRALRSPVTESDCSTALQQDARQQDPSIPFMNSSSFASQKGEVPQRLSEHPKNGKTASKARKGKHPTKAVAVRHLHTTRAATRQAGSSTDLYRGIEDVALHAKPTKPSNTKASSTSPRDNSVVKIQMLTGTLFLYRKGPKPYAKFVRTK